MAQNNVLQYVGARYVPVFYQNPNGTWDWLSGVQYEPLTIVKYGTSTYTSRQLVPASIGSPNTAPEYWALTGDYNGAIVDIQNRLNEMDSNISVLNGSDKNVAYGRSILLIGDSYATGSGTPGGVGWMQPVKNFLSTYGATVYGTGVSGSSLAGGGYLLQYQALSHSQKESLSDIYICGGANERNFTEQQVREAATNFMSEVRAVSNRTSVTFVFVGNALQPASAVSQMIRYSKICAEACIDAEIRYYNKFDILVNPANMYKDGDSESIHPSLTGHGLIARNLINIIYGCDVPSTYSNLGGIIGGYPSQTGMFMRIDITSPLLQYLKQGSAGVQVTGPICPNFVKYQTISPRYSGMLRANGHQIWCSVDFSYPNIIYTFNPLDNFDLSTATECLWDGASPYIIYNMLA